MNRVLSKQNVIYWIYSILAIIMYMPLRNFVDSSDMLAYIVLAKNYLNYGLLSEANSHWSPLISWLLVPFLFVFDNPISAFHILQLLIGFTCIYAIKLWIDLFDFSFEVSIVTELLCSFLISYYAFIWGTPDLLFLSISLLLQYSFVQPQTHKNSIVIGVLGGLLFLSKSFGLIFFVVNISLIFLLKKYRKKYTLNSALKSTFFSILFFALVCSFWIGILSFKFHHFTYSSATDYNFNIMNPSLNPDVYQTMNHPALLGNLIAPFNDHSLFYWTTPYTFNFQNYNPFQSDHFSQYLKVVGRNLSSIRSFYFGFDGGTVLILLILYLVVIKKKSLEFFNQTLKSFDRKSHTNPIIVFVLAAFISLVLYSLILINHRYIWLADIALVLLFFCLINQMVLLGERRMATIFSLVFCFVFIIDPAKEIYASRNQGKMELACSDELLKNQITGKRIATLEGDPSVDVYTETALISFYSNNQFYGLLSKSNFENGNQLNQFGIDYLFQFTKLSNQIITNSNVQLVLNRGEVKIYKVLR